MKKSFTLALGLWVAPLVVQAQHLYQDLFYHDCAKLRVAFLPASSDEITTAVRLPNNKLMLAGSVIDAGGGFATYAGVSRHNADGSLDPTFGTGGKAIASVSFRNSVNGMAMQADGKILLAGVENTSTAGSTEIPGIIRLTADGRLDTTFGNHGETAFRFESISSGGLIQPYPLGGGKTLVVGYVRANINGGVYGIGACRLLANGQLDPSFGSNGSTYLRSSIWPTVKLASVGGGADSLYYGLGLIEGGNIYDLIISRFTKNGFDPTFFGGDFDTLSASELGWSGIDPARFCAVRQADGKIVFGVSTFSGAYLVYRMLANGFLDGSFGTSGKVVIDYQTAMGSGCDLRGISLLPNGKIMLAGAEQGGFGIGTSVLLNANGTLDTQYGSGGFQRVDMNRNQGTHFAVGVLPDGPDAFLFYGTDFNGDRNDYVLCRMKTTKPVFSLLAEPDTVCPGNTGRLRILPRVACGPNSITWLRDGQAAGNDTSLTVTETGNYQAVLNYGVYYYLDSTNLKHLHVSSLTAPTITQDRGLLTSSVTGTSYQWSLNNQPLPGSNSPTYLATVAGTYTVTVFDGPCHVTSSSVQVTTLAVSSRLGSATTAYYDPGAHAIQIQGWLPAGEVYLMATDGKQITLDTGGQNRFTCPAGLASGLYRVVLKGNTQAFSIPLAIIR